MTAVLHDEVVTVAPARKLTVVRDFETARATTRAPAPKKVTRRISRARLLRRRRPGC